MKNMTKILAALFVLVFAHGTFAQNKNQKRTREQLYQETQARTDGKDSVYYIKGSAYSYIPGERPAKIFNVEGYNIRRRIVTSEKDGYFVATREVVFYKDPKTDAILSQWENPWTKEKVEVFQIQNDPVNFRVREKNGKFVSVSMDGKREFGEANAPEEFDDSMIWTSDIFPFYPLEGFEKNYTASEMFDFYVSKNELEKTSAPKVLISWTRVGPWLPWMKMPSNGGVIIIHARSVKMENWSELPERLKKEVREKYPLYMTAPETVDPTKPNETSWTFYNREMKKRQKQ